MKELKVDRRVGTAGVGRVARNTSFGILAALALLGAGSAWAADAGIGRVNPRGLSAGSQDSFWTPERFRAARPLTMPQGNPDIAEQAAAQAEAAAAANQQVSHPGSPPLVEVRPNWQNRLFTSPSLQQQQRLAPQLDSVIGNAKGSSGFPYTTLRVFPDAAVSTYPYRAAGKIFFRDTRAGTLNICSGAVIGKRLIGTAGHCVYNTVGNYFYDNIVFIPAYRNGAAPYGRFDYAYVRTTTTWTNGGETFPNRGDFAIIEVVDSGGTVGSKTGWLGWVTGGMVGQHLHTLGYPGNIDNGERMQETTAETRSVSGNFAGQLGSEQRGGSSGGPWVRDFGITGAGSNLTPAGNRNRIVGFVSYGPTAVGPNYQGSTTLNADWVSLYNAACARRAGNC